MYSSSLSHSQIKMGIEASPPVPAVAKKLWNIVRIVFFMLRKGIAKSKIMVEFHLMLKRGKLAGKAIVNNLLMLRHHRHHRHHAAFTCRSRDPTLSFVSPRHYEFSCSNSPAFPIKRKHRHCHHFGRFSRPCQCDDASTMNAVQKALEMLNDDQKVEASPLVTLPGFGKSPIGRQLRITDSPFPVKDEEDDHSQVDMAAEEFIKRFYKDLNLQQSMAALESPYHYNMWDR